MKKRDIVEQNEAGQIDPGFIEKLDWFNRRDRKVLNKAGDARGLSDGSQKALVNNRFSGRVKRTPLTDALLRAGDVDELAGIIIASARNGESWAVKLWAAYVQSPELTWRLAIGEGATERFAELAERLKVVRGDVIDVSPVGEGDKNEVAVDVAGEEDSDAQQKLDSGVTDNVSG